MLLQHVRVWYHEEAESGAQTYRKYKVGKGQRLIVVGAVTEDGFLPGQGGGYTFRGKKDKSTDQPADYHHEVGHGPAPSLTHTHTHTHTHTPVTCAIFQYS